MKRLLLNVAAMAAMAACSEATLDEGAPEAGRGEKVTIAVSAATIEGSRVTVADDWSATWDKGDELLAINGEGATSEFSISQYDATSPTFSGYAPSVISYDATHNRYNLLYPSSMIEMQKSPGSCEFVIDLTSQNAAVDLNYMRSTSVYYSGWQSPVKMDYITVKMELDMKFTGYDGYTIEKLEVGDLASCGTYNAHTDTVTYDLSYYPITIVDGATKIEDSKDGIAKVRFNIHCMSSFAKGDVVPVTAYLMDVEGDVVLSKGIVNDGSVSSFSCGKYYTLKCGFSSDDEI